MDSKLAKLEYVRGAAAFYVFLGHFLFGYGLHLDKRTFLDFIFRFGQEAVIIFFLLSGFVIHFSTTKKITTSSLGFKKYFLARFLRIYPILFVVFVISYFSVALRYGYFLNPDYLALLGNIFMLQDFSIGKPNVIVDPYMGNGPLWSLSYEWWFYMMYYPLVSRFSLSKNNIIIGIVSIIGVATYTYIPNQLSRFMMYFSIWWIGVFFADAYMKNIITIKTYAYPFALLFLCTFGLILNAIIHKSSITSVGIYPILEIRHFSAAIFTLVISLIWYRLNWVLFDKFFSVFKHISPFSYALYIAHVPIIGLPFFDHISEAYGFRYIMMFLSVILSALFLEKYYHVIITRFVYKLVYTR
ncbi:MAG: acyltransferase [Methylobacter sp.]|nr:MAG: acyltransferase [Methylobacter sp.]